jgi:hypothetical protein
MVARSAPWSDAPSRSAKRNKATAAGAVKSEEVVKVANHWTHFKYEVR